MASPTKESAVWRERGATGRGAGNAHIDGAMAALDRFDQKISPKSSRRHSEMVDSAKEIRRRMLDDLRSTAQKGGGFANGKKHSGVPLRMALNSVT